MQAQTPAAVEAPELLWCHEASRLQLLSKVASGVNAEACQACDSVDETGFVLLKGLMASIAGWLQHLSG